MAAFAFYFLLSWMMSYIAHGWFILMSDGKIESEELKYQKEDNFRYKYFDRTRVALIFLGAIAFSSPRIFRNMEFIKKIGFYISIILFIILIIREFLIYYIKLKNFNKY